MRFGKHRNKIFVYLASRSPRRREILREMGIAFKLVPSRYIEAPKRGLSASKLVLKHAIGKVRLAVIPTRKGIVLGADTVICCSNRILGKPQTMREAIRMLTLLSGRAHIVYTGVALFNLETGKLLAGFSKTKVYFNKLTRDAILNYLKKIHPFDKAGSYAIQQGNKIVRKVEGSYSNVLGLPKELISIFLREINKPERKK